MSIRTCTTFMTTVQVDSRFRLETADPARTDGRFVSTAATCKTTQSEKESQILLGRAKVVAGLHQWKHTPLQKLVVLGAVHQVIGGTLEQPELSGRDGSMIRSGMTHERVLEPSGLSPRAVRRRPFKAASSVGRVAESLGDAI